MSLNVNVSDQLVAAAYERVTRIDLSAVKKKLTDGEHGSGWSEERAEEAERLYRYFLALQCVYASCEPPVVPPKSADDFWHQHILDTRKYEADCLFLFGRFLHHFPYFGMRGPDDARALDEAGQWTFSLLRRHFGKEVDSLAVCSGSCSSCRTPL